jgi:hypothetical protein
MAVERGTIPIRAEVRQRMREFVTVKPKFLNIAQAQQWRQEVISHEVAKVKEPTIQRRTSKGKIFKKRVFRAKSIPKIWDSLSILADSDVPMSVLTPLIRMAITAEAELVRKEAKSEIRKRKTRETFARKLAADDPSAQRELVFRKAMQFGIIGPGKLYPRKFAYEGNEEAFERVLALVIEAEKAGAVAVPAEVRERREKELKQLEEPRLREVRAPVAELEARLKEERAKAKLEKARVKKQIQEKVRAEVTLVSPTIIEAIEAAKIGAPVIQPKPKPKKETVKKT